MAYTPLGAGIWHYAGGNWTNIPGAATRLSVAPDGSVWAINGWGGIYHFSNGVWYGIAGGASDVSVAADGSLYVVSSVYGNGYGNAIYHYVNGTWTQMPGAGVRIAASWDTGSWPGGITPGGYYLVNALGSIFYYAPSTGYTQLPGAAAQLAPTVAGGLFALGFPASETSGDPVFYNDLSIGSWLQEPGAAVSIATNSTTVYAIGAAGGIYSSPVVANVHAGNGAPLVGPNLGPGNNWGPTAVANSLDFPVQHGFNGSGSTVAIVAPGNVYSNDLGQYASYFQTPVTNRSIRYKLIAGASQYPNNNGSGESTLDTETIAGLAPGANILLYVIPNLSTQSEIDAYNAIISDGQANVVSSSFGGCESHGTGLQTIFAAGANAGVAFVASSGDQGNTCFYGLDLNGQPIFVPGVSYPASDPNVTAVGGTETLAPAVLTSTVTWNDSYTASGLQEASGGGISAAFGLPLYQQGLAGTASQQYRNIPDVSMPADSAAIVFNGAWQGVNGTSWGAPQFAAMLAEVYQYCGSAFKSAASIPYVVHNRSSASFIDVLSGNNQYNLPSGPATPAYSAGPGYDNVTGLGVPLGMPFAQALCPNGIPAVRISSQPGRVAQAAIHTARPFSLDITPRISNLSKLRRKAQNDLVRVQIVLKPGTDIAGDEQAVSLVLRSAGFSIVRTFKNHLVVDATASNGKVERLFSTKIVDVPQGQLQKAYAPVAPITVPASLAPFVSGMSLDNVVNMIVPRR